MSDTPDIPNIPPTAGASGSSGGDGSLGPPPRDELDGLLRQWHDVNAQRAAAGRDRLMAALGAEAAGGAEKKSEEGPRLVFVPAPENDGMTGSTRAGRPAPPMPRHRRWRRVFASPFAPLAAAAVVVAALLPFMLPSKSGIVQESKATSLASNIVMAPEAGRLDALDKNGNLLGPCALKHTDVKAEISGRFSRVTVTQEYHNPHPDKIEAVYTFPLSERSGVDRMKMTIGDRVIVGEVQERQLARRVYEQARDAGRTASLLEQERPNIFAQSVANIEPGATITIEISYVEIVAEHDGELSFDFPTVVSPRYIPGVTASGEPAVPAGAKERRGVVLAAPATVARAEKREGGDGERSREDLRRMLARARPIEAGAVNVNLESAAKAESGLAAGSGKDAVPAENLPSLRSGLSKEANQALGQAGVWYDFSVEYPDGSQEPGVLLADGRGEVGGRWFACDPTPAAGEAFARSTDKVPDANRITPMPTRPDVRAGHDLSISVTLDTGGPGIFALESPLHKTVRQDLARNGRGEARRVSIALENLSEIPNRDFVLHWKQSSPMIGSRMFAHTGETGNFFSVQLEPPTRVADALAVPRELVFVVDTSGSMQGRPMAVARTVIQKAVDAMRPQDTFNVIGFSGATRVLWDRPRPSTPENRAEAQRYIETWEGSGGTEMMAAIETALDQNASPHGASPLTLAALANIPADGRNVSVVIDDGQVGSDQMSKGGELVDPTLEVRDGISIKASSFQLPEAYLKRSTSAVQDDKIKLELLLRGTWETQKGERLLRVASAEMYSDSGVRPLRIVMFLTDGEVGNDYEIIEAIRKHRATTRVFSFGIGNSVNRFLIEQMALVGGGGGEPEYVYVSTASDAQAAAAVERFNRRTKTPLLTDISVTFDGVHPVDVLPATDNVPDLFDNRPLTFIGRYTDADTGGGVAGSMTIRGQAATGKWEQKIPLSLPANEPENSSLPTLWARGMIDELMAQDLMGLQRGMPNPEVRAQIIRLGERFNVMSPYTSFVAVDKLRVTIDGKAHLVRVPVELPAETSWEGYFGSITPGAAGAGETGEVGGKASREKEKAPLSKMEEPAKKETEALRLNRQGLERVLKLAAVQDVPAQKDVDHDKAERGRAGGESPAAGGKSDKAGGVQFRIEKSEQKAAETIAPPKPAAAPSDVARRSTSAPAASAPAGRPAATVAGTPPPPAAASSPPPPAATPSMPAASGVAIGKNTAVDSPLARTGDESRTATYASKAFVPSGAVRGAVDGERLHMDQASPRTQLNDRRDYGSLNTPSGQNIRGDYDKRLDWKVNGNAFGDTTTLGLVTPPVTGDSNVASPEGALAAAALDLPANDTTGCVQAIATAQLVDDGRIDEAKQLACSSANLLQNCAPAQNSPGNNNDWVFSAGTRSNTTGNRQQNTAAPVALMCDALSGNLPADQRKAAIEEARARATSEYRDNQRFATLGRKLAPELLARTRLGLAYGVQPPPRNENVMNAVRSPDAFAYAQVPRAAQAETTLSPTPTTTPSSPDLPAPAGGYRVSGTNKGDAAKESPPSLKDLSKTERKTADWRDAADGGGREGILVSILLADTSAKALDALKALGVEIEVVKADASVVVARVLPEKLEELALMEIVRRVELVGE